MKTISLSVRVPAEDADFLAGLEVPGASTPSDKLRAIIAEARRRHEGFRDFNQALAMAEELLRPARGKVRAAEHENRVHSELVAAVYDWLPEAVATATSAPGTSLGESGKTNDAKAPLQQIEQVMADRLFMLIESVLRLGVTKQCRCYDPHVVTDRLQPVIELARLIDASTGASTDASGSASTNASTGASSKPSVGAAARKSKRAAKGTSSKEKRS